MLVLGTRVAIASRRFRPRVTVSQSPVGKTDGRSIVFSDSGCVFQLKRIVIVAEDDWDDMRKQGAGHDSCKENVSTLRQVPASLLTPRLSRIIYDNVLLLISGTLPNNFLCSSCIASSGFHSLEDAVQSRSESEIEVDQSPKRVNPGQYRFKDEPLIVNRGVL